MADRFEDMLWRNIRKIRSENDERFVRWVLEARADFLRLRLRQEPAIRAIYLRAADNVADQLRNLKPTIGQLTRNHLRSLEKNLRKEADNISRSLSDRLREDLAKAVEAGAKPLQEHLLHTIKEAGVPLDPVKVQRAFGAVNTAATEALWSRTHKGLMLSDRIWKAGDDARQAMQAIIQDGVARGRDAVAVAKDLEKYARHGAGTLAKDYPNMMQRMKGRVPKNLSYEALRLARTEMSNAFWEGTIAAGRMNSNYKGVRIMLSSAHAIKDICDDMTSADLYGMGPGCYPNGEEPTLLHPQCMCTLAPIIEPINSSVERWKKWANDPTSDPELEKWYNEVYRPTQQIEVGRPQRSQAKPTVSTQEPDQPAHRLDLPGLSDEARTGLGKALDEVLKHGKETGNELLVSIDAKTGGRVHPSVAGEKGYVNFPRALTDYLKDAPEGSVIMVHNHPESSSFSDADLNIVSKFPSVEWMTVIGHNETMYAVRVGKGKRPDFDAIKKAWMAANDAYYDYYYGEVRAGRMTAQAAWVQHSHRIVEDLAKHFGWTYIRSVPGA